MAFDLMRQKTSLRKRAHALVQRAIYSKIGRKTLIPFLRALDAAGGLAITTHIEPLEALQYSLTRGTIIDRVLKEYPERTLPKDEIVYRLRANPEDPATHG